MKHFLYATLALIFQVGVFVVFIQTVMSKGATGWWASVIVFLGFNAIRLEEENNYHKYLDSK